MPTRIEFVPSRTLPVLSIVFYSMLLSLPWILPWGAWNLLWAGLAMICAEPFFKQLKRKFKSEILWIELEDNKISAVKTSDGSVHRVESFKVLRLLVFYIELRIVLSDRRLRLGIFKDMLDADTLCALRRFFNGLPKNQTSQ